MSEPECSTGCGRPSPDGFVCHACIGDLEQALAELPATLADLAVTATRQDKLGPGRKSVERGEVWKPTGRYLGKDAGWDVEGPTMDPKSPTLPSTPHPVAWDAAALHHRAVNTVTTWIRHMVEMRGLTLDKLPLDVDGPGSKALNRRCSWLLRNIASVRQDEAAGEMVRQIVWLNIDAKSACDRTPDLLYVGKCDAPDVAVDNNEGRLAVRLGATCGADLYAQLGIATVDCKVCGFSYDVESRRDEMREAAEALWARPQLIADALTSLGRPLNADTLRKWIERDAALHEAGRRNPYPPILRKGKDENNKPLYLVKDVMDRIEAIAVRKQKKLAG